ncbi:unnamed protein product [Echinostoma caproni]|uniref:Uncharacterized protein n=1 Tax=Echinostoma caproni TaxID=27848 RepID=A0A183AC95_9TREM|nr:unnamed protein product [Echinostoma caproni]
MWHAQIQFDCPHRNSPYTDLIHVAMVTTCVKASVLPNPQQLIYETGGSPSVKAPPIEMVKDEENMTNASLIKSYARLNGEDDISAINVR